ncbi:MAG TPA: ATP-binding protein, partial [Planctomycetota bacterium]
MQLEPAELLERIAEGEGKRLEFKRGLPGDAKVARTLGAFANTRGGLLLIGVGDRGELVGAPRPRTTMAALRRIACERLEPELAVAVGSVVVERRTLVWCAVPVSPARPHAVVGDDGAREVVARVGASNRRASGATLRAIQAG